MTPTDDSRGDAHGGVPHAARGEPADDPLGWLEESAQAHAGARVDFQEQLAACDRELVAAARLVAERIKPVTSAFLNGDAHTARESVRADAEVDSRCAALEEACYTLIARQSPVARDLRRVVAVLRSIADVQRSGDLLRHVAETLAWIHPPALSPGLRDLVGQLGTVSADIYEGAIQAWETHDGLAANELGDRDDEVDLLQKLLLAELYTGRQSVEEAVSLALIARYYERIADHAVQIARQVAYFVTGDRVPDS